MKKAKQQSKEKKMIVKTEMYREHQKAPNLRELIPQSIFRLAFAFYYGDSSLALDLGERSRGAHFRTIWHLSACDIAQKTSGLEKIAEKWRISRAIILGSGENISSRIWQLNERTLGRCSLGFAPRTGQFHQSAVGAAPSPLRLKIDRLKD